MKMFIQRLALVVASAVVTLLVLELIVRVADPQQLVVLSPDIWRPAEGIGYRHQENANTTVNLGGGTVRFVSDAEGFRVDPDKRPKLGAVDVPILMIGDSFVEGLHVGSASTMSEILRGLLERETGGTVRVDNAGVAGWNPNHYLIEAHRALGERDYDLGIVVLYVGNDIVHARSNSYPARRPLAERHRARAPRNLSWSEIINAWLYPANDFFETRSHLFVLVKAGLRNQLARIGLTPVTFPPIFDRREEGSERWAATAEICADVARAFAKRQTPVGFVLVPTNYQVHTSVFEEYVVSFGIDEASVDLVQPNRLLAQEFEQRGLFLLDPLERMRASGRAGARLYGAVDNHLNDEGHRVVAESMLSAVLGLLNVSDSSP